MKKVVLVNLVLVIALLALIDFGGYWLLPDRAVASFPGYRNNPRPDLLLDVWPENYYIADSARGFDIGLKRHAQHQVDGVFYPVWSNDLGCFDDYHGSYGDYVYFAGDSFTWGYAPYEEKFGTLIERATGQQILKCGVEHTGQRHQFAKFVEITTRTASVPKAVFVFHFENDIANDYAYPHSTVIDGHLVDAVVMNDDHQLIRRTPQELSAILAARLKDLELLRYANEHPTRWSALKATVRHYSVSASLLAAVVTSARSAREARGARPFSKDQRKGRMAPGSRRPGATENFYAISYMSKDAYRYRDNPFALPNQAAILDFKHWTDAHHVPLVIILIPRNRVQFDTAFFREMHRFLDKHQIRFLDLAGPFVQRRLNPSELYWRSNAHFNRAGNAMVAAVLRDSFPQFFVRRGEHSSASH